MADKSQSFELIRRLIRDRKGATAVEFAIIAPLLIMTIFGTLEVGRALYVHSTIQHAVEVSARYAMAHPDVQGSDLRKIANANGLSLLGNNKSGANSVSFFVETVNVGNMKIFVINANVAHEMSAPLLSGMEFTISSRTRVPTLASGVDSLETYEVTDYAY